MKKITILSIAFIAISFASCKKDYTCSCTYTTTEPGAPTTEYSTVFKKTSKKSAKSACVSSSILPDGEQFSEVRTCSLK
jgi:hypothetical protein